MSEEEGSLFKAAFNCDAKASIVVLRATGQLQIIHGAIHSSIIITAIYRLASMHTHTHTHTHNYTFIDTYIQKISLTHEHAHTCAHTRQKTHILTPMCTSIIHI